MMPTTIYRVQLRTDNDWATAARRHKTLKAARRAAAKLQSEAAGLNPKTRVIRTETHVVKKNDLR